MFSRKRNIIFKLLIIILFYFIIFGAKNTVFAATNINKASISTIKTQTYTGRKLQPKPTVKYAGKTLTRNKDYTLKYYNNLQAGTASVKIQGIGNYTGSVTKKFKINPRHLKNVTIKVGVKCTYTGGKRNATVKMYNDNHRLKIKRDYTLSYKNNVNTGIGTVTIKGRGNFTGTVKKNFYVLPKKATITSVIMNTKNTKATITWKKDNQASGYAVYSSRSKNGKYNKIKVIKSKNTTKYTVNNLKSSRTYYFKIRAFKTIKGKRQYSKYSSTAKTNTGLLATITLKSTTSNKNRNTNLKLACKAINGTVLKPGKTFDWYKVVGQATKSKGYKKATIFENGRATSGLGGGVCQVSTTVYQAAKKAKLKIVERHTHSLPVTYTKKGKDATVAYKSKNLRKKNNKKYAIKFVTSSSGAKTTCKIYRVNL